MSLHLGCMKTANVSRATPCAAAARTQCRVATSNPPACTYGAVHHPPHAHIQALLQDRGCCAGFKAACKKSQNRLEYSVIQKERRIVRLHGSPLCLQKRPWDWAQSFQASMKRTTCAASPTWKARWSGGMLARTVRPARSWIQRPAAGSGHPTSLPLHVYMPAVSPKHQLDKDIR